MDFSNGLIAVVQNCQRWQFKTDDARDKLEMRSDVPLYFDYSCGTGLNNFLAAVA